MPVAQAMVACILMGLGAGLCAGPGPEPRSTGARAAASRSGEDARPTTTVRG